MLINRLCERCGQQFLANRKSHIFCHVNCRMASHRAKQDQPEIEIAKQSIFAVYKEKLNLLTEQEIYTALGQMWTESAEAFKNRHKDESLLSTMLREKQ